MGEKNVVVGAIYPVANTPHLIYETEHTVNAQQGIIGMNSVLKTKVTALQVR